MLNGYRLHWPRFLLLLSLIFLILGGIALLCQDVIQGSAYIILFLIHVCMACELGLELD